MLYLDRDIIFAVVVPSPSNIVVINVRLSDRNPENVHAMLLPYEADWITGMA